MSKSQKFLKSTTLFLMMLLIAGFLAMTNNSLSTSVNTEKTISGIVTESNENDESSETPLEAELNAINAFFTNDDIWSLNAGVHTNSWSRPTSQTPLIFNLTFLIEDELLKYTLVASIGEDDNRLVLHTTLAAVKGIKNADQDDSYDFLRVHINELINRIVLIQINKIDKFNKLFTDDENTSWEFNDANNWLTTINNKGSFKLMFTFNHNWTLIYTLENTEITEDKIAFWSAFNAARDTVPFSWDVPSPAVVNTLINEAYEAATELNTINMLFDEELGWSLDGTVLTSVDNTKGTFKLTFIINSGMIKYTLENTEIAEDKIVFWSVFNAVHNTFQNASNAPTPADINTLINDAYEVATELVTELNRINTLFDEDLGWSFNGTVLTSVDNTKGTFKLTFIIDSGMIKYTLENTEIAEDKIVFWSVFNAAHSVASDATTVNTLADINTLINDAYEVATELVTELNRINTLFDEDLGWSFNGTVLTSVNNDKGTFVLTFLIENGTLKYTLSEIANADDADWSTFNSAHSTSSDTNDANTLAKVNALIATGHTVATETAEATSKTETATTKTTEKAKGSAIGIIAIIIIASIALVAIMFLGYRFIKKRN